MVNKNARLFKTLWNQAIHCNEELYKKFYADDGMWVSKKQPNSETPNAGLKPMQLHWAPRHGVWVDC